MMSELGRETVSAYAAAKGGLKMLTRNICSEYGLSLIHIFPAKSLHCCSPSVWSCSHYFVDAPPQETNSRKED